MKKLLTIALVLVAFNMQAQDTKENRMAMKKERVNKMNAEDIAEIQTKKMVLALDLSDAQQKQVKPLHLENAKRRLAHMKHKMALKEKGEQPSDEMRLKMLNDKLDHSIATKREMKKILNEAQYEKWNERNARKHKMGRHKKKGQNKEKESQER